MRSQRFGSAVAVRLDIGTDSAISGGYSASMLNSSDESVTVPHEPLDDAPENRSGLLRALKIIMLLADRGPESLGVSAISRDTGIPKAVAHRMVKELTGAGFLRFDDVEKAYSLGPGALTVGLAALRSMDVPRVARPHLERLVRDTGETATLSARQGLVRVYVDQVLSPKEVRMSVSVGPSYPLYAGSSSKAILAALPQAFVDDYLRQIELSDLTSHTITDPKSLLQELDRIRAAGYAVSQGERQSAAGSVAAAIRTAENDVFGSVSLCGPLDRFDQQAQVEYGTLLAQVAAKISSEIGHHEL